MKSCRYCRSKENLTIDHKVPITQGGTDDISNLQCLCKRCNGIKSGLSHKQVLNLWRWFTTIQNERELNGKKPYAFNKMSHQQNDIFNEAVQEAKEECDCKGAHEDDCHNRKVCEQCDNTGVVEIMGGSDADEWGIIDTKPCVCQN